MTKVTGIFLVFSEAKINVHGAVASKEEMGGWKPVKKVRVTFSDKLSEQKRKEPYTEKVLSNFLFHAIHDERKLLAFSLRLIIVLPLIIGDHVIIYKMYLIVTFVTFHFHAKEFCLLIWQILEYKL